MNYTSASYTTTIVTSVIYIITILIFIFTITLFIVIIHHEVRGHRDGSNVFFRIVS